MGANKIMENENIHCLEKSSLMKYLKIKDSSFKEMLAKHGDRFPRYKVNKSWRYNLDRVLEFLESEQDK